MTVIKLMAISNGFWFTAYILGSLIGMIHFWGGFDFDHLIISSLLGIIPVLFIILVVFSAICLLMHIQNDHQDALSFGVRFTMVIGLLICVGWGFVFQNAMTSV